MYLTIYLLALGALAVLAAPVVHEPGARDFVIILGVFGAWHWSWDLVHLARALIYRHRRFPRWRRRAGALGERGRASQVFIVVTTFRSRGETTARVFQAAIAEAVRYGSPVTIVAAIVEMGDQRLIKRIFAQQAPPPEVRLMFVRRPGLGKRHAVACALRAIARQEPLDDAAVLLMDGDTLLMPETLGRSLPFLAAMPEIGGITTDEDAIVAGSEIMQAWHSLRFAQRHQSMSSMSLSKRLGSIGRMSIYRASIATDPAFIDMIEHDRLDHWRLGRIPLLTGEDESAWFWLLMTGRGMLYLPDVRVVTIEHPSSRWFVKATTVLMLRCFGNMLRSNGRAIALGPRKVGRFAWWCLVDQRVSMWTALIGPLVALFFILTQSGVFLWAYLLWVGATRLLETLLLLTARPRIHGLWPLLIYYGQVYGALIKTYILFRLDRRGWTRQTIRSDRGRALWQARFQSAGSAYLHGLALAALATAVAFLTNALSLPPLSALAAGF